jgi:tRNA A37 threonylcarbamoyladenosine synthetase subunit TsaC/SUA5/YrdC
MDFLLKIDPGKPDAEKLAEAVRLLREGGVVAFPTETFYGLGADARNETAVEKIFRIKGRDFRNPIALIVADDRDVIPLVEEIPATAKILMQRFWPGPLTLIFRAAPSVSHGRHGKDRHPRLQPPPRAAFGRGAGRPVDGNERQSFWRSGVFLRRCGHPRPGRSP